MEPTFSILITIYYLALFIGFLTLLFVIFMIIMKLLDLLSRKYKILWMMVEYCYYKKEFKEFFKEKKSVTGRFNKI